MTIRKFASNMRSDREKAKLIESAEEALQQAIYAIAYDGDTKELVADLDLDALAATGRRFGVLVEILAIYADALRFRYEELDRPEVAARWAVADEYVGGASSAAI